MSNVTSKSAAITPQPATGGTQPKTQTYTPKDGDTLSDLALRFLGDAARASELKDLNPDKIDDQGHIKSGVPLIIRDGTGKPTVYVTQPGDNLSKLALRFFGDASRWTDIRDANKDKVGPNARIQQNIPLTIPAAGPGGSAAVPTEPPAPPPAAPVPAPAPPGEFSPPPPNGSVAGVVNKTDFKPATASAAPLAPPPPGGQVAAQTRVGAAQVTATAKGSATVDSSGIKTAEGVASFKALIGHQDPKDPTSPPNTTIDVSNGIKITNNKLTEEQFKAAIASQFGSDAAGKVAVNGSGQLTWTADQGITADVAGGFTAAYQNLKLGADGNLSIQGGKVSGDLKASIAKNFSNGVSFDATNELVLNNSAVVSDTVDANLVKQFGPSSSLATQLQVTATAQGIQSATMLAGYKTLIGSDGKGNANTSIDVSNGLTITNNKLTGDQFKAAISSQFGSDAALKVSTNAKGQLSWTPDAGVSAELTGNFTAAYQNLKMSGDGDLALKDGTVTGDVRTAVAGNFASGVEFDAVNQVVLKNSKVVTDAFSSDLASKLGPSSSLSAQVQATFDNTGAIQSATAVAGFKTLIGSTEGKANTSIDVSNGITITNNALTADQFKYAIASQFGSDAAGKVTANSTGQLTWTKDAGVSGDVTAGFTAAFQNLKLSTDGNLTLQGTNVSGDVKSAISGNFGSGIDFDAQNQVTLKNNQIVTDQLAANLAAKLGPSSSLSAQVQTTLNAQGVQSATVLAGFKTLVGNDGKGNPNTSIDVSNGITITNNALTADQFKAAIASQFGKDAAGTLRGNAQGHLTFSTWKKDGGVSGEAAANFTAAYKNLQLSGSGNLSFQGGQASGDLKTSVSDNFGPGVAISANNDVVLQNNKIVTDSFQSDLAAKLGPSSSLSAQVQATVNAQGVQSATAVAGFKTLIGKDGKGNSNTSIDVSNGITITNNQLTADQFRYAIASQFGNSATAQIQTNAKGQLSWTKDGGVSGDVSAQFTAAYKNLKLTGDGNLTLQGTNVSGDVKNSISGNFASGVTFDANNQLTLKNNKVVSDSLNADLTSKLGPAGSISAQVQATVDAQGIQSATMLAGFKTLIGKDSKGNANTSIDVTNKVVITNNKLTADQFKYAIASQFGNDAAGTISTNAKGQVQWSQDGGVSGDLTAGFTAAYKNLKMSGDGALTLQGTNVSGEVKNTISGNFGSGVSFDANNQVILKNSRVVSDSFNGNMTAKLGPSGSLSAQVQATVTASGIQSATAVASFKTLIGKDGKGNANTSIDVSNGITITNNKLTADQFKYAIASQFGSEATGQISTNATGQLQWTQGEGVSGDVTANFTAAYKNLKLTGDGALTLQGNQISGELKNSIAGNFGSGIAFDGNNQVILKNNKVVSDSFNGNLTSKLGANGSLSAQVQATVTAQGIETANVLAGFKTLIGKDGKGNANTSIDVSNGVTITNNKLTADQFKYAIASQFGSDATGQYTTNAKGQLSWTADKGVSGDLQAGFTAAYKNLKLTTDGNLTLQGSKVSGSVKSTIAGHFASGVDFDATNEVILKDNKFVSDSVNAGLVKKFGTSGSVSAQVQATVTAQGIQSANILAGFKTLIGKDGAGNNNTSIDVSNGITITNNKLTGDQFKFAIASQFGSAAAAKIHTNATGQLSWTKDAGVSGQVQAGFTAAYKNLTLGTDGNLSLQGTNVSGTVKSTIQGHFASGIDFDASNQVTLQNNKVVSDTVNADLVKKFGASGSLSTQVQATVNSQGIQTATVLAGFKTLIGKDAQGNANTSIDVSNGITITNNKLTGDQFRYAISSQFGSSAAAKITTSSTGQLSWTQDGGVSADVQAHFSAAYKNLTLGADGNLQLKGGQVSGDVKTSIAKHFASGVDFDASNDVILQNGKVVSDTVTANLVKNLGDSGNISSTVQATIAQGKLVDAAVSLSAVKTLKAMHDAGQIKIGANGSIELERDPKTGKMTSAEDVAGLITLAANKEATVTSGAQAHFVDGSFDSASFNEGLGVTVNNTTLTSGGTLTLNKDPVTGKISPQLQATAGAMFGKGAVQAGGSINITGVNSGQVNLKLASAGKNAKVNATGTLDYENGHLAGAGVNLTSNLISGGKALGDVTVGGNFVVTKDAKQGNINLGANVGPFSGSFGVAAASTAKIYTPDPKKDKARADEIAHGGVWGDREATFNIQGSAGANVTVPVAGVPVQLGFKVDGSKGQTVKMLSLYPNQNAALDQPPVLVMHPPTTVAQILAMQPHEQVSQSGNQSIGMSGNVAIGYAAGPANISVGGSVYHQISGNMSRDIERLDGNKVRVRFTKGSGSTDVKTLSASVGVNADKALPGSIPAGLKDKAKPIIEQLATAGISHAWQNLKENDTTFDVTIDLSTPQGKAAMEHMLKNDLSEAQYWAGYGNSGVQLNSSVTTDLKAKKQTTDIHIGTLDWQHVNGWLDKEQSSLTPSQYTIDDANDRTIARTGLFPWNKSTSMDMRLVHETKAAGTVQLPNVDAISTSAAGGALQVRTPPVAAKPQLTLADSKAVLGLRVTMSEKDASLKKVEGDVDPALAMLHIAGIPADKYKGLAEFRDAMSAGLVPDRKAVFLGLFGDKRYGDTSVNYTVMVSPQGLDQIARGHDTSPTAFRIGYLMTEGDLNGKASIFSRQGVIDAMQKSMGARITADDSTRSDTTYTVTPKSGPSFKVTADQLETLRVEVANFRPPPNGGRWSANFPTGNGQAHFTLTSEMWDDNRDVLRRADAFANESSQMAQLYQQNAPPPKNPNESDVAYKKRVATTWKPGPLFNQPEAFWQQMETHFNNLTKNDSGSRTAAITLSRMAGSDRIYARAELTTDPAAVKAMIDSGRANIQRFAAVDLLSASGAKVQNISHPAGRFFNSEQVLVLNSPPANLGLATSAAKSLFGANVQITRNGNQVTISNLKWPSNSFKDGLAQFLNGVTTQGTRMTVPASWDANTRQTVMSEVFGNSAVVSGSQVVFDNRAYGAIHFGDALTQAFGNAFGPEQQTGTPPKYSPPTRFPLLQPIADEGASQVWDKFGGGTLTKWKGANADWGTNFGGEAYLSETPDLSKAPAATPGDWILTGQQ